MIYLPEALVSMSRKDWDMEHFLAACSLHWASALFLSLIWVLCQFVSPLFFYYIYCFDHLNCLNLCVFMSCHCTISFSLLILCWFYSELEAVNGCWFQNADSQGYKQLSAWLGRKQDKQLPASLSRKQYKQNPALLSRKQYKQPPALLSRKHYKQFRGNSWGWALINLDNHMLSYELKLSKFSMKH